MGFVCLGGGGGGGARGGTRKKRDTTRKPFSVPRRKQDLGVGRLNGGPTEMDTPLTQVRGATVEDSLVVPGG